MRYQAQDTNSQSSQVRDSKSQLTGRKGLTNVLLCFAIVSLFLTELHAASTVKEPKAVNLHAEAGEVFEAEGNFWVNLSVVLFCTMTAGLMSGLTIGLASIDRLTLEIDSMGDPDKLRLSKRIFPVIDQHHWMLVTLLLCNACAMESLPIFLDKMVTPTQAIIASVTLVLIFGEIIPQALCTGSGQLTIAYYCCPMVLCIMYATSIVTWPLAKLLDHLLGEHKFQRYDNNQLKKLVLLHSKSALQKVGDHIGDNIKGISEEQALMIEGALTYQNVKCHEVLTRIDKVSLKLRLDTPVTEELLDQICELAFSRIPIVDNDDQIVGVLLTKSLIGLRIRDGEQAKLLSELLHAKRVKIVTPIFLSVDCTLNQIVKGFKDGTTHLAVVCETARQAQALCNTSDNALNEFDQTQVFKNSTSLNAAELGAEEDTVKIVGILTLENIIERVLQTDIHDEKDFEQLRLASSGRQPSMMYKSQSQHNASSMILAPQNMAQEDHPVFRSRFIKQYYNQLASDITESIRNAGGDGKSSVNQADDDAFTKA